MDIHIVEQKFFVQKITNLSSEVVLKYQKNVQRDLKTVKNYIDGFLCEKKTPKGFYKTYLGYIKIPNKCPKGYLKKSVYLCDKKVSCPNGFKKLHNWSKSCTKINNNCPIGFEILNGDHGCYKTRKIGEVYVPFNCPSGYEKTTKWSSICFKSFKNCPNGFKRSKWTKNECEPHIQACPNGYSKFSTYECVQKPKECPKGFKKEGFLCKIERCPKSYKPYQKMNA